MIRGINRMTVEVSSTDSPYFERAICFVRPQYASARRLDLHRAACGLVQEFDMQIEAKGADDKPRKERSAAKWLTAAAAGAVGLAAGALLAVII